MLLFTRIWKNNNAIILQNVELREYTDQFERFKKLPIPFEFKVYIFNVTNAENYIQNNEKPIIQEIGPYIYR